MNQENFSNIKPEIAKTKEPNPPTVKKSTFGGDVLKLVSGTTVAQLLTVVASPILARLYAPETFGVAAIFVSITNIITMISCMRYQFAIMLPETDEEAANLLGVSLSSVVLISLLTLPIPWLGRDIIPIWLNEPQIGIYLWLIPPFTLVSGTFLALNYWNSRTKHFGRLSVARVIRSVGITGPQLGVGVLGYTTGGSLIVSNMFGQTLSTIVLGKQVWHDDKQLLRQSINWKDMLLGIKRHRKFPLYGTWSALLNTISWQLPTFLLASFFSSTIVGYYALGTRLLRMPMNFIGTSIAQVFFQRAAEAKAQGNLATLVENTFRRLVTIGLFPMLILTITGQDFFILIFGQNWAEAGVYVQILSVWTFFWFISSPLSTLFSVLEKQEFGLKLNTVIFSSRLISLGIGGLLQNARLALILFAISGVLVYGYLSLAIMSNAGVTWFKAIHILVINFLHFIPAGAILIILKILNINIWIQNGVAVIILAGYVLYILKHEKQLYPLLRKIKKSLNVKKAASK